MYGNTLSSSWMIISVSVGLLKKCVHRSLSFSHEIKGHQQMLAIKNFIDKMNTAAQHYLCHCGWRCRRGCASQCSLHQTSPHKRCGCGLLAGSGWEGCCRCCWSNPEEKSSEPGSVLRRRAGPGVEVARWASSSLWRISMNTTGLLVRALKRCYSIKLRWTAQKSS